MRSVVAASIVAVGLLLSGCQATFTLAAAPEGPVVVDPGQQAGTVDIEVKAQPEPEDVQ